jgi:hypothetical protein
VSREIISFDVSSSMLAVPLRMILLSQALVELALCKSVANVEEHEEHKHAGANCDPHVVAGSFCATDQCVGGVDTCRVVATTVDCREMHRESC